jgi:hypothetical protein
VAAGEAAKPGNDAEGIGGVGAPGDIGGEGMVGVLPMIAAVGMGAVREGVGHTPITRAGSSPD